MPIEQQIQRALKNAISQAFPEYDWSSFSIELTRPPQVNLGDFAFHLMNLKNIIPGDTQDAKAQRKAFQPMKKVQELAEALQELDVVDEVQIAGPYINIFVDAKKYPAEILHAILQDPSNYGHTNHGKDRRVMVEYSSPNTNKPQHIGHARNNVLGDTVSNLREAAGFEVVRANLVNDRGIHITKSMLAYQKWGEGKTPESENIKGDHFVGDFYVKFESEHKKQVEKMRENGEAGEDVDDSQVQTPLLQEAQKMLQLWEADDPEVMELWNTMTEWVMNGFRETYNRMGVTFDTYYFESNTYKLGRELVKQALENGAAHRKENGAVAMKFTDEESGEEIEKVLLRPDGTSVYMTQDLGTAEQKFEDLDLDESIYVVASEQDYHFKVLFKLLEMLGFAWADSCYHLSYGMVYLPEGKMKSREGTVVDADELMDTLHQMALERIQSKETRLSREEVHNLAEAIGLGALKFYIARVSPQKDINFDPKASLNVEEATGPYLQYTHARASSILEKAEKVDENRVAYEQLNSPEERRLIHLLADYPGELHKAASGNNPATLCNYLLELGRSFNEFYQKHRVIGESSELAAARTQLVASTRAVLANGLGLLGIHAPHKM